MPPSPAPDRPELTTEPRLAGVADERCLLVASVHPAQEESLVRYASFWAAAPTDTLARDLPVHLASPRSVRVQRLHRAGRAARAQLLAQARAGGVDALAVADQRLARDLVRAAPCSVWFVPERGRPRPRRLLVPVDFTLRAADCLRVAVTLARISGAAECVALHVRFNDAVLTGRAGEREARREVWARFEDFMRPIDTLGVRVTPALRDTGDVAGAIRDAASQAGADLVVLASRGRTWAASLLQPSVAEQALGRCQVPVLVIKHFGATRGLPDVVADRLRCPENDLHTN